MVECADWRDALNAANRIEAVVKGLQGELLTAMPSVELMGDVCERLQPVISMLRKGLQWVRSAPLPPLVGNLVWTPDQILADVKRAMKMAYEESHPGLREVAYRVAVRAAAFGLESLNNPRTTPVKPSEPIASIAHRDLILKTNKEPPGAVSV